MRSVTGFKGQWTEHWGMSLFTMLACLLCVRLGFWQVQRGIEKQHMLAAHQSFAHKAPNLWLHTLPLPAQYQPVVVQGHWMPDVILLDNQSYKHQFGYHVLSPLVVNHGQVVLVDRGWVVGDMTRHSLPKITKSKASQLSGSVYYPSEKGWVLGSVVEKEQPNLLVVELIDIPLISQFLHKPVYPFIIRLGEGEPNGYIREWTVVSMSPQRHYGYALQWFALALVVLIGYISFIRHQA